MNKISTRQLCFFLATVAPIGKLVLMPDQLAYFAQNDLLFCALINFLLQGAILFAVLWLARDGRTFYQIIAATLGEIAAKIVSTLLALFLLYASLLPLLENTLFVQSVFYDTLPSLLAFSPFFLLSAYLCANPFSSLGRVWDILAPVALVGFLGIFLFSVGSADFGALRPVGKGSGNILQGAGYTMSWFFDGALIIPLLGRIDYRKGTAWKGTLCYLSGGGLVLLFLAIFYGIYGDTAVGELFALAKLSQYFSGLDLLGRIDYLFIFALAFGLIFYCAMPLHGAVESLKQAWARGRGERALPPVFAVAVNVLALALVISLNLRFGDVNDAISKTLFWFFPALGVFFPLLGLVVRRFEREKI